jgi:hypothetical protein
MVRRKFVGQTSAKVVRLADIYRVPKAIYAASAEDINATNGIKDCSDGVVLKFVRSAAISLPE